MKAPADSLTVLGEEKMVATLGQGKGIALLETPLETLMVAARLVGETTVVVPLSATLALGHREQLKRQPHHQTA